MSINTMQQILMHISHAETGREAFLLFAIPDPDGVGGHPLQCHCSLINAFAADPKTIQGIELGNTLVIEGPGDFAELACLRLKEILGRGWNVEMFQQRGAKQGD